MTTTMIIVSNERANERRLTFSSATRLTTVGRNVRATGGPPLRYPCPGKRSYNKILIFYLRPIAETTDAPTRRSCTRVSGMSQSLRNVVVVAHYLHNVELLCVTRTKEDGGDKIITTTTTPMSCSIL